MKHRIFTVLSALSLLLFVAFLALWADTGYLRGPRGYRSINTGLVFAPTHYLASATTRSLGLDCERFSATPVPGPYVPANGMSTPQIIAWQSTFGPTSGWHWKGFAWASAPLIFTSPVGPAAESKTPMTSDYRADGEQLWMRGWQSHLGIPYWALLVMFGIMPPWWLLAYRRRRLAILRRGHCPICDYDLRASKERCPECGTPIAPANAADQPLTD